MHRIYQETARVSLKPRVPRQVDGIINVMTDHAIVSSASKSALSTSKTRTFVPAGISIVALGGGTPAT